MSGHLRFTQQEADPIGAISASPIVAVGAVLAFLLATGLTWSHWSEVGSPPAAVLALVLVAAAGVAAAFAASPARAPFTNERLWLVVTLAVGAAIAEYVSTVGNNQQFYDDFGPTVIGMLILSLAPFCTWVSAALAGVFAAAVLSILVVGASMYTASDAPVAALITLNAAPVLAMSAAAAGYSYGIVAETLAWQREANRAALQRDAELRAGIARSVQQSRVSVLGREVLPFLAGVMTAERISVADADRARELAEALRRALRAGIESTWLDELAANIRVNRGVDTIVDDPTGAAAALTADQRSALTALISWLGDSARSRLIKVAFTGGSDGGGHRDIVLVADSGASPPSRRELDRFVAVARAVALRADAELTRENVKVGLSYDID
ncbi:hypothetical protein [Agromyces cerinus]|uniref:Signal transduction histidine kinase n=1 Tax=Agromyces cerinus subsp. cerinus TaxID=232089 RepID=A0A1N6DER6_9MICO|nr:hypothetical protein [Agromyces cerinus]SIN69163.1 hypothetical protein SAMN05443544_0101 [Agromyces cerinus subsp. cerinus]